MSKILSYILKTLVLFYQRAISPLLGQSKCRFQPTCSHYMIQAIEAYGPFRGTWMGMKRIGKCHPWGGHGYDPVPPKKKTKKHSI